MNFQIETTSFCNLTCQECPNWKMERKRTFMSDEVWDTILHKYVIPFKSRNCNSPPTLIPHKDGEPLLNKRIMPMLKRASDAVPDINISFYTHGLLLKREHFEFFGSLPNRVRVLISFHFHNHDGTTNDYTKVTSLLKECVHHFKPGNVELIFVSHLIKPMTAERLDEWKASWQPEISTGRLTVHTNASINPWTGLISEATCHYDGCPEANFGAIYFGATGNVIACCMDLEEEISFGSVLTEDPDRMYGSLDAFYAAQRRREVNHRVCRNCFGLPEIAREKELVQIGTKT